ncbi:MAG: class I SAM-dependent methyltransferase [Rhodobacteraceae bacterium]|nr:class I SAM-dependent methyltransferase [Paracoccaceae bacterium]
MEFAPSVEELESHFVSKYGPLSETGWGPRLRHRFGYFTPDATTRFSSINWSFPAVGGSISARAGTYSRAIRSWPESFPLERIFFVGVDPDDTIHENEFVHRKAQARIEEFETSDRFDLVTLRMVAEHMDRPEDSARSIATLLRAGGKAVVYTVNKWAPASIVSSLVPFRLHHVFKRVLWGTDEKDTFPVAYKLNTRRALRSVFGRQGLEEVIFRRLDDCRSTGNYKMLQYVELTMRGAMSAVRLRYPENCLLGVYEKR